MFKSKFLKLVGAITLINIAARFLGFYREVIIGFQYGTSYQADSIITAFTIPNFIYLVFGGAVTTAFISVYTKLEGETRQRFIQSLFTRMTLIIGAITVVFMVFPAFWIKLFFSGMDEQSLELTSKLFAWTAPATFFLVLSVVLSGLHNIYENYRLSTFSGFLFNLVYLVIGVGLTPLVMEYSYALGATLGAGVMVLFLMHYTYHQKLMSLKPAFHKMPEAGRFLKLVVPLIFGGASIQFYFIIQRIYAAGLDGGAIASLNYASKMTQFPQAVLMASVTTIIYPMLAKAAGEGDMGKLEYAYKKGFKMLTLILLPVSVFLIFYAKDIISFIYQYGNFSADSTNATYPLLQLFSLTVLALALNTYVTRFFYALENTILPIILSIITIFGINILIIKLFIGDLGAEAIAWGTIVSAIINTLLLILFAKLKLGLAASSWGFVVKLVLFTVIAVAVQWSVSLIPVGTFLALVIGGVVTGTILFGGLKFVK